MTRMLASVKDRAEADVVLRLGADVIDLKDAAKGAMVAVDLATAEAVVAQVGGRRETSVTLGDPPYEPSALLETARAFAAAKVDYLKAAVEARMLEQCGAALADSAGAAHLIGVIFADAAPDFQLLPKLKTLGFKGAMLDTRRKCEGRLLDLVDVSTLERFCSLCRAEGLMSGLAGSLEAPDVPRLLLVRPDVLGFRGALCRNHDREAAVDPQCVSLIRDLIPRERPDPDVSPKIDWRLLARGIIGGRDHESDVDRVYVRDFVIPASIGAYDFERAAPQRVVFDVEAVVRRAVAHADDMREIFSYDVILDSIRLAVGRGHIQFVETLAEDVAAAVLRHARVRSVRVSVRKIDVIEGAVGVEIHRERSSSAAESRPLGVDLRSTSTP
ncbi:MAG TPA: (5-formylfuran-3-yl)methyl phosphate synthase [Roseiarcus sp.]|nr:(5-formylfuran-3-yl)methyl phosphate synthase [Roseiarcus sp.]